MVADWPGIAQKYIRVRSWQRDPRYENEIESRQQRTTLATRTSSHHIPSMYRCHVRMASNGEMEEIVEQFAETVTDFSSQYGRCIVVRIRIVISLR